MKILSIFFVVFLFIMPINLSAVGVEAVCILSLASSDKGITAKGSPSVATSNCSIAANSTDASSVFLKGSGSITTDVLQTAGQINISGGFSVAADQQPFSLAIPDPFAGLSLPPPSGGCVGSSGDFINGSFQLSPGRYCDGINIINSSVTLAAGVYVIEGDLKISGASNVSGQGVLVYIGSQGNLEIDSDSSLEISASNGGDYAGVAIIQDGIGSSKIHGSVRVTGAYYDRNGELEVAGSANWNGIGHIVVGRLTLVGNPNLLTQFLSGTPQ